MTEVPVPHHPQTLPPAPPRSQWWTWRMLVVAFLAFGAWAAWLSWARGARAGFGDGATGHYEPWQVGGCVATLAVAALIGGVLSEPWRAALVITVVFTLSLQIYVAAHSAGVPMGGLLVATGVGLGSWPLAALGRRIRRAVSAVSRRNHYRRNDSARDAQRG